MKIPMIENWSDFQVLSKISSGIIIRIIHLDLIIFVKMINFVILSLI